MGGMRTLVREWYYGVEMLVTGEKGLASKADRGRKGSQMSSNFTHPHGQRCQALYTASPSSKPLLFPYAVRSPTLPSAPPGDQSMRPYSHIPLGPLSRRTYRARNLSWANGSGARNDANVLVRRCCQPVWTPGRESQFFSGRVWL